VTGRLWRDLAACATVDPELWFEPDHEHPAARQARETAAKAICAGCPVRAACLHDAVRTGEMIWAIRGGLTAGERRAWLAAHWQDDPGEVADTVQRARSAVRRAS
jgi:WhiB family redox-sensing transcriptional regulator